jgi:hypothetical protein
MLPADLRLKLEAKARQRGMKKSRFIRYAIEMAVGSAKPQSAQIDQLVHLMDRLAVQVKKLGTNVNQLAKQANNGMVPVNRGEIQYILNQHQLVLAEAKAAFEKVLT